MRRTQSRTRADLVEEHIRRAGTIGELERLAGIAPDVKSRTDFWLSYAHLPGASALDAGVEALKQQTRMRVAEADRC